MDYSKLFSNAEPSVIGIYEMLSNYHNKLRLAAKARANANNFQYVWPREGNIFAKKAGDSQSIPLVTNNDLKKIA